MEHAARVGMDLPTPARVRLDGQDTTAHWTRTSASLLRVEMEEAALTLLAQILTPLLHSSACAWLVLVVIVV